MPTTVLLGCLLLTKFSRDRKTYKFYCEIDELPNPRPTQLKKKRLKSGISATFFFSHRKYFFVGWDCFCIGNRVQETQPNQFFRKNPITGGHSNQDQIWLVKKGEYIGFYADRRSWLLCSPVILSGAASVTWKNERKNESRSFLGLRLPKK